MVVLESKRKLDKEAWGGRHMIATPVEHGRFPDGASDLPWLCIP